ncbi:MAG: hypothetical protein QY321_03585 [Patescibacteria group bacterium]|nr:MAG: hypothetical protein QY321_03585 [Patescibacteria group bacterium]
MNFIKKHIKIIIIVLLIMVSIILFLKIKNLEHQILNIKAIPSVELVNYLSIGDNDIISGSVVGFVKFNNTNDQPINLQQYIKITALDEFDSNGNQIFLYQDIIKMDVLAPRYLEPIYLKTVDKGSNRITMSDDAGNLFFINKYNREVGMFDATSDNTILITDNSDFRRFIFNFYSN